MCCYQSLECVPIVRSYIGLRKDTEVNTVWCSGTCLGWEKSKSKFYFFSGNLLF